MRGRRMPKQAPQVGVEDRAARLRAARAVSAPGSPLRAAGAWWRARRAGRRRPASSPAVAHAVRRGKVLGVAGERDARVVDDALVHRRRDHRRRTRRRRSRRIARSSEAEHVARIARCRARPARTGAASGRCSSSTRRRAGARRVVGGQGQAFAGASDAAEQRRSPSSTSRAASGAARVRGRDPARCRPVRRVVTASVGTWRPGGSHAVFDERLVAQAAQPHLGFLVGARLAHLRTQRLRVTSSVAS